MASANNTVLTSTVKKTGFGFEYDHPKGRLIPFWTVATKTLKQDPTNKSPVAAVLLAAFKTTKADKLKVDGQDYGVKLFRINKDLLSADVRAWQVDEYGQPADFSNKADSSEGGTTAMDWCASAKKQLGYKGDSVQHLEDLIILPQFKAITPVATPIEDAPVLPPADVAPEPPANSNDGSVLQQVIRANVNGSEDYECILALDDFRNRLEKMIVKENTPQQLRDVLLAQVGSDTLFPRKDEDGTEYKDRMVAVLNQIEDQKWKNRVYWIQKRLWQLATDEEFDNTSRISMRTTISDAGNHVNASDPPAAHAVVQSPAEPAAAAVEAAVEQAAVEEQIGVDGASPGPSVEEPESPSGGGAEAAPPGGEEAPLPAGGESAEAAPAGGEEAPLAGGENAEAPPAGGESAQISADAKFFKEAMKKAEKEKLAAEKEKLVIEKKKRAAEKEKHEAEEECLRREQELDAMQAELREALTRKDFLENENGRLSDQVASALKDRTEENKKLAKNVTDNVNQKFKDIMTAITNNKKDFNIAIGEVKQESASAAAKIKADLTKQVEDSMQTLGQKIDKAITEAKKEAPRHVAQAEQKLQQQINTAKSDLLREVRNEATRLNKLKQSYEENIRRIDEQVTHLELGRPPGEEEDIIRRLEDLETKFREVDRQLKDANVQAQNNQPVAQSTIEDIYRKIRNLSDIRGAEAAPVQAQNDQQVAQSTIEDITRRLQEVENSQWTGAGSPSYSSQYNFRPPKGQGRGKKGQNPYTDEDPVEIIQNAPKHADGSKYLMLQTGRHSGYSTKQVQYIEEDQLSLHGTEIDDTSDPMYAVFKEWSLINKADRLRRKNERVAESRRNVRRMQDKLIEDQWDPVSPERRPELSRDVQGVNVQPFAPAPQLKTEADLEKFEIWNRSQCVEARKLRLQGQTETQVLKALQAKAVCPHGQAPTRQQETLIMKSFAGSNPTKQFLGELGMQYRALKDKAVRSLETRVGQAHGFKGETRRQANRRFRSLLEQAKTSGATWNETQEAAHLKRFLATVDEGQQAELQAKTIAAQAGRDKPNCQDWEQAIERYFGDTEELYPDSHWQQREAEEWEKYQKMQKTMIANAAAGGSMVNLIETIVANDEEAANFVGGSQRNGGANRNFRGRSPGGTARGGDRDRNNGSRAWTFHRRNSRGTSVNADGEPQYEPRYDQRGRDYESPRRYPTPRGTGFHKPERSRKDPRNYSLKRYDRKNAKDPLANEFGSRVKYDGYGQWAGENKVRELRRNQVFLPWKNSRTSWQPQSNRSRSGGSERSNQGGSRQRSNNDERRKSSNSRQDQRSKGSSRDSRGSNSRNDGKRGPRPR